MIYYFTINYNPYYIYVFKIHQVHDYFFIYNHINMIIKCKIDVIFINKYKSA